MLFKSSVFRQVPNGRLVFHNDWAPERTSDQMVSWTWRQFLKNPEKPELLCWFPMTKATLRAMDMTEEVVKERLGNTITSWSVSGGSKRGWTTWLVAAVDPERVKFQAPIVCDFLNFSKTIHRWLRNLGGIQIAQIGYWLDQVHEYIDEPHFADFADPIIYKDRMTMPKMIISGFWIFLIFADFT